MKAGLVDQPKFFENYVADRFKTHLGMLPQFRALEASEADKHWVRTKRSEAKCRSVQHWRGELLRPQGRSMSRASARRIVRFIFHVNISFRFGQEAPAPDATGPTHDKVHPRIGVTAKWIWTIYLGLTITEIILLVAGGMNFFDSVCHSLTTTATGGYSTKQNSIAAFNSPYIEYIITLFMFLAGINFTLLYLLFLKGNFKRLFQNTELHWYLGTVGFFTLFTTVTLIFTSPFSIEESFRKAIFQVVSLQTTTGFISADYMTWVPVLWTLMCIIMLFGACAGSTTGGIKCIRIAIMSRVSKNEFKHIIHPNAILPVRINRQVISSTTKSAVLAFIFLYMAIIFIGWLVLMLFGVGFEEAYSVVISSLGNVGPGIGKCGPSYSWNGLPDAAKWISAILMLIGRLELFTVLLLFMPSFWKKH